MADFAIPRSGVAYIFYTGLVSQANTMTLKSSPTLAAGDFKVSIDGGALANLATLPTNTPGGVMVKISLSAAEMTGDNITVVCIDAAGAEWCDQIINIQTSARGIADLAYPATSGRSIVVDAAGLVDANAVKVGPTGAGTAQTAVNLGLVLPAVAPNTNGGLPILSSSGTTLAYTVSTITTYTGNTPQTGDSFARIGLAGVGLTNLGDTRIANLDAAVSSRVKPADTLARVTLVDTTTANTDMRGTDGAALASVWTATRGGYVDNLSGGAVMLASGYTAPPTAAQNRAEMDSNSVRLAAIKAKTDNLPAAPAAVGDVPTANANADALLARNVAGGSSAGRTVSEAFFAIRNKVTISGGTMTVYSTDDTTSAWTAAVTGDATADPITSVDPG